MEKNYLDAAKIFKAFCDENRLRILDFLQGGEKCACELLESLNVSQSTLSHHMKILVESDVINARKEGKWTYYSISSSGIESAKKILNKLSEDVLEGSCQSSCDCSNR